jgi:hypothetical protein
MKTLTIWPEILVTILQTLVNRLVANLGEQLLLFGTGKNSEAEAAMTSGVFPI